MTGVRFLDELGDEFEAAIRRDMAVSRRPVGRRRLLVAAAVAVVAAGVFFIGVVPRPDPAQAVEIRQEQGGTTVRLLDLQAPPEQVQAEIQELRQLGIDIEVFAAPVPPEFEGKFVGLTTENIGGVVKDEVDEDNGSFRAIWIPDGFPGRIELVLGRPAQPSEDVSTPATTTPAP